MYLFLHLLKIRDHNRLQYTAVLPTTTVFFHVAQNRWYHPTLQSTLITKSTVRRGDRQFNYRPPESGVVQIVVTDN